MALAEGSGRGGAHSSRVGGEGSQHGRGSLKARAEALRIKEARQNTPLVPIVCEPCEGEGCETCGNRGNLEMVPWEGSGNPYHYQYDDDVIPNYQSWLRFDERRGIKAGVPAAEE